MSMSELILDIETIPDENLPTDLRPEPSLGNLKDPVKIEAKVKEWEGAGQIKKMSLSPFMCQIVSIQAWSSIDGYVDAGSYDETQMLNFIDKAVSSHDLIIGHNIMGFDFPVIKARSMITNHETQGGLVKFDKSRRYSSHPIFDTMQELAGWDKDKWKGLDWWCKRLGISAKSNHGSNVYQMWKEGKRDEINDYCRDDVTATKELYDRIKAYYK